MSRALAMLLMTTLVLGGCSGVMDSLKSSFGQPPTATVTDVRLAGVDLQSVTLDFEVEIMNPYSFALPLTDLDYALSTNAQPFLNGSTKLDGSVPAEGMKSVVLPIRVDLVGLLDTVKDLRPGQVIPYDAELGLNVDVPGTGPLRLPVSKSGELPIPTPPSVSVASLNWDSMSLTEITGTMLLDVENKNEFPLTVRSFGYDLSLDGNSVAHGERTNALWMSAGHKSQVGIPLSFSPGSAGVALLGMLGGSLIDYSLAGSMEIDTSYGLITMPFAKSGRASQSD